MFACAETGFDNIVHLHFGDAISIIRDFPADLRFDFVFVDGEKASYLDFWHVVSPRLSARSVLVFDDMIAFPEKTQSFFDFIRVADDFEQIVLPIDEGDGILLLVSGH